jgi:hypothetical protein
MGMENHDKWWFNGMENQQNDDFNGGFHGGII